MFTTTSLSNTITLPVNSWLPEDTCCSQFCGSAFSMRTRRWFLVLSMVRSSPVSQNKTSPKCRVRHESESICYASLCHPVIGAVRRKPSITNHTCFLKITNPQLMPKNCLAVPGSRGPSMQHHFGRAHRPDLHDAILPAGETAISSSFFGVREACVA
jgi:hypothetical protein